MYESGGAGGPDGLEAVETRMPDKLVRALEALPEAGSVGVGPPVVVKYNPYAFGIGQGVEPSLQPHDVYSAVSEPLDARRMMQDALPRKNSNRWVPADVDVETAVSSAVSGPAGGAPTMAAAYSAVSDWAPTPSTVSLDQVGLRALPPLPPPTPKSTGHREAVLGSAPTNLATRDGRRQSLVASAATTIPDSHFPRVPLPDPASGSGASSYDPHDPYDAASSNNPFRKPRDRAATVALASRSMFLSAATLLAADPRSLASSPRLFGSFTEGEKLQQVE
jgi:hypothetical protein